MIVIEQQQWLSHIKNNLCQYLLTFKETISNEYFLDELENELIYRIETQQKEQQYESNLYY
jgi:hypothetical protein